MKSKSVTLPIISVFTILAIITACQPVQLSPKSPLLQSEGTSSESATTIKGKVEFPEENPSNSLYKRENNITSPFDKGGKGDLGSSNSSPLTPHFSLFTTKALLSDVATSATVALIYPSDHQINPNVTIATGLTDFNGNFIINPSGSFSPALNSVYVLEASKRIVSNGNVVLTVRTLIHWTGSSWDSITIPGIYINTKTTALSIISGQRSNDLTSLQTIGKMPVVNGVTTITNITGTPITADLINKVEYLVKGVLNNNGDPVHYISYVNGGFDIVNPSQINTGKIFTVAGCGDCDGYPATSVSLSSPSEIALDSNGNIFITDFHNNKVMKVDKATETISVFAGNGIQAPYGYSGDVISAKFAGIGLPEGIALDSNGDIFIASKVNGKIVKVNKTTGIISTVAGNGFFSYSGDGAQATSASLANPSGIAFDINGNIFIADSGNNRIRKVNKLTGIISTVAGNGIQGYSGDGSQATSANLDSPIGLAIDNSGNIYIADSFNHRIRKVDKTTGIIATITGDGYKDTNRNGRFSGDQGPATSASLFSPTGLLIDNIGNLYISDSFNHRIRKVDITTGIISTIAGDGYKDENNYGRYSGDLVQATSASLNYPRGITFDANGNILLVDKYNHRIRKIDKSTDIITTIAGGYSGDGGQATSAKISFPEGIALDNTGNIYVSDTRNQRIRKVDITTGIISTIAGNGNWWYSGDDGKQATLANLNWPASLVLDNAGNIFFANTYTHRIRKVDKVTGIISTIAGNGNWGYSGDGGQATSTRLNKPLGIALDNAGNLYIADSWNNMIRRVDKVTGIITTVAGKINYSSEIGDGGQATSASLNQPSGIALDSTENIYIADSLNNRIRKVDVTTGIISTIAGNGNQGYSGDGGQATSASLNQPSGIALDISGNIYFSDGLNHRIRKVDKLTGIISTIAGDGYKYSGDSYSLGRFSGDGGQAESASLNWPSELAIDSNGDIYIADSYNGRIRKIVQN